MAMTAARRRRRARARGCCPGPSPWHPCRFEAFQQSVLPPRRCCFPFARMQSSGHRRGRRLLGTRTDRLRLRRPGSRSRRGAGATERSRRLVVVVRLSGRLGGGSPRSAGCGSCVRPRPAPGRVRSARWCAASGCTPSTRRRGACSATGALQALGRPRGRRPADLREAENTVSGRVRRPFADGRARGG